MLPRPCLFSAQSWRSVFIDREAEAIGFLCLNIKQAPECWSGKTGTLRVRLWAEVTQAHRPLSRLCKGDQISSVMLSGSLWEPAGDTRPYPRVYYEWTNFEGFALRLKFSSFVLYLSEVLYFLYPITHNFRGLPHIFPAKNPFAPFFLNSY